MKTRFVTWFFGLGIALCLALHVVALHQVPFVADEPDDVAMIVEDLRRLPQLFSVEAKAADQARLPHLLALPVLYPYLKSGVFGLTLKGDFSEIITELRWPFLFVHLLYLLLSYRWIRELSGDRNTGLLYVLLLVASCYFAGFSIFALTTGNSLYLLFHLAAIVLFYRGMTTAREGGVFEHYLGLSVVLGLCIASKLFGVLLLIALFISQLILRSQGKPIAIAGVSPRALQVAAIGFVSAVLCLNYLPMSVAVQFWLAGVAAALYLAFLLFKMVSGRIRAEQYSVSLIEFWGTLVATSFCITLIFSPIYLNVSNIFGISSWLTEWNQGAATVRASLFDMPQILLLKYGFVSALVLALVGIARRKKLSLQNPLLVVLGSVLLIHLLAISLVTFKVVWYPLAIFPLLYLPLVWLWHEASCSASQWFRRFALAAVLLVVGDNAVRYLSWFPYAHFDGAQYGQEYIGWDKPALVTFEFLPLVEEYFAQAEGLDDDEFLQINLHIVDVPRYNDWLRSILGKQFAMNPNLRQYAFITSPLDSPYGPPLILSSPVYNPDVERALENSNDHELLMRLTLKGIQGVSVWRRRSSERVALATATSSDNSKIQSP